MRHAVNYDNGHNKNRLSVDSLLPDSTEKLVHKPLVSFFNCLLLMTDFSIVFYAPRFGFVICQDKYYKRISLHVLLKKRNPAEAISLKAILYNRNL